MAMHSTHTTKNNLPRKERVDKGHVSLSQIIQKNGAAVVLVILVIISSFSFNGFFSFENF